jgi:predicted nucleotidyltransferase
MQEKRDRIMNKEHLVRFLEGFKNKNQERYDILRMGIFGSVARGTNAEQSDVDVVVVLKKQDMLNFIGIKQDLEEELHLSVDVVSYREGMNRFLKKRIDAEAVYVCMTEMNARHHRPPLFRPERRSCL